MPTSLWRDTTSGVYLLGSIHYLPNRAYPLPFEIQSAYSEASVVSFEARPDRELDQSLGLLPGRVTLPIVLGEELYRQLSEAAGAVSIDLEGSSALRPFAIAFNILRAALQAIEWESSQGVDAHLLVRADADGKLVEELEDMNYFARRIRILGMEAEKQYLAMILNDLPTLKSDQEAMLEAWSNGDVSKLETLTVRPLDRYPLVKGLLLTERNRNWLPRLRDYRRSGRRVLVIVGVAHLVGEGNLRELLEARGASFEQL